jgi:hypothetical protein
LPRLQRGFPRPCCVNAEHDEAGVHVVGHVLAGLWHWVNAMEVAGLAKVRAQPILDLLRHLIRLALQLFRAILS